MKSTCSTTISVCSDPSTVVTTFSFEGAVNPTNWKVDDLFTVQDMRQQPTIWYDLKVIEVDTEFQVLPPPIDLTNVLTMIKAGIIMTHKKT